MGTVAEKVKSATTCCTGERRAEEKADLEQVPKEALSAEDEVATGDQFLESGEWGNALKSYYEALELYKSIDENDKYLLQQVLVLCKIASVNLEEKKNSEAARLYEEALDMLRSSGKGKEFQSDVMNSLAAAQFAKGEHTEALEGFNRAYDAEAIKGEDHVLAGILNNIGLVYLELGKFKRAREYFERAVNFLFEKFENESVEQEEEKKKNKKKKRTSKKKAEESVEKNINLETTTAEDKKKKRRPLGKKKSFGEDFMMPKDESSQKILMESSTKAENETTFLNEKMLSQIRRLAVREKCVYADTMTNLGIVFEIQNEQELAIRQYKIALKVYKQIYEKSHSKFAMVLNNLGNCYRKAKKYKNAKKFYDMALELKLHIFGEEHSQVSETYSNLGLLYEEQKDLERASEYYSKSLKGQEGDDEVALIDSLQHLLRIYNELGKFSKSVETIEKIIEIQETILENDDIEFISSYVSLAWIYKNIGNRKDAVKNFELAEKYLLSSKGKENEETIGFVWCNMAEMAESHGELSKAKELYKKALEKLEFSKEIKGTLLVNYATILYNEGEINEAEQLFEEARKIFGDLFEDKDNPKLMECDKRLKLL